MQEQHPGELCYFVAVCSDGKARCHFESLILGAIPCNYVMGKSCPPEETDCPDGQ